MENHEGSLTGQYIGHLRLLSLIGRGPLAEVYLAEHQHLARQVAVKIFLAWTARVDPVLFRQEISSLVRLEHAHILPVLETGFHHESPYIVTPYAPGGNLRQPASSRMPIDQAARHVEQIAGALTYAYQHVAYHGDLKPENMLLQTGNHLLLADFSLPGLKQQIPEGQVTLDTMLYTAPEQFLTGPNRASDQYALACIVYEWLSGQPPFSGTITEVMTGHISQVPRPLHELIPRIPRTMSDALAVALEKEPQKRFPHIDLFAKVFSSEFGMHSRSASLPPPTMRNLPPDPGLQGLSGSAGDHSSLRQEKSSIIPPPLRQHDFSSLPADPSDMHSTALSLQDLSFRGSARGPHPTRSKKTLNLIAVAQAALEPDERAIINKTYVARAGITQEPISTDFASNPFQLKVADLWQPIVFDISIHASENIELTGDWQHYLRYEPTNKQPQLVTFPFRVQRAGEPCILSIDFYRERRWLRTIKLEFMAVAAPEQLARTPIW